MTFFNKLGLGDFGRGEGGNDTSGVVGNLRLESVGDDGVELYFLISTLGDKCLGTFMRLLRDATGEFGVDRHFLKSSLEDFKTGIRLFEEVGVQDSGV